MWCNFKCQHHYDLYQYIKQKQDSIWYNIWIINGYPNNFLNIHKRTNVYFSHSEMATSFDDAIIQPLITALVWPVVTLWLWAFIDDEIIPDHILDTYVSHTPLSTPEILPDFTRPHWLFEWYCLIIFNHQRPVEFWQKYSQICGRHCVCWWMTEYQVLRHLGPVSI